MRTKIADGIEPLAIDQKILALIEEETDPYGPGPGTDVFGVRNAQGQIYRRIQTEGARECVAVITGLQALGLTNEMKATDSPRERCTGIFSMPKT